MVDKLYRFENYSEIEDFMRELECTEMKKYNCGPSERVELTDEQKKKIYKIYEKDFEILGYEP